jgi:SAM-dependent methyltransferase
LRLRLRRLRVRMRLRRRRSVKPWLPPLSVLEAQDAALAPMRSRIFRRIGIAHRSQVLDLGAGRGVVTGELKRRSRGTVVALDREPIVAEAPADEHVVADAADMPFEAGRFDLVYAQYVFLWNDADARRRIAEEIARVLAKDGVLLAVEPDWGGALEHPEAIAIAPLVSAAIARAGGEPDVGRRLPSELREAGFEVRVEMAPEIEAPAAARFAALSGLLFTDAERAAALAAEDKDRELREGEKLVHVPQLFVTARRR